MVDMREFNGCYLLVTDSPTKRRKTYIGYTKNPQNRIRQHNGEVTGGAVQTRTGRPWTMVMVVYGFASQRHALQFEWAWQHPEKSHLCKPIYAEWQKRGLRSADAQVKLAAEMLSLHPFCMYPLTVQVLSVKFAPLWRETCPLPPHITIKYAPMKDIPITVPLSFVDEPNDSSSSDGESTVSLSRTAQADHSTATYSQGQQKAMSHTAPGGANRSAHSQARERVCTHAVDLCDSLDESDGSSEGTVSDLDMQLDPRAQAPGSGGEGELGALSDPGGMYARATRGNLVEKSPGKCADCAKKLDKNWFRCPGCGRLAHDECWAPYLRKTADGQALPASTVLPDTGACPACSHQLTWLQVLTEDMSVQPPGRSRRRRPAKKRKPKKGKAAAVDAGTVATSAKERTARAPGKAGGAGAAPAAKKSAAASARKPAAAAGRGKKAVTAKATGAAQPRGRTQKATHGSRAVAAASRVAATAAATTAASTGAGVRVTDGDTAESAAARTAAAAAAVARRQRTTARRLWAWSPDRTQRPEHGGTAREASGKAADGRLAQAPSLLHAHAQGIENIDRNTWGGYPGDDSGADAEQPTFDVPIEAPQFYGLDRVSSGDSEVMLTQPQEDQQFSVPQAAIRQVGGFEAGMMPAHASGRRAAGMRTSRPQPASAVEQGRPVTVWEALAGGGGNSSNGVRDHKDGDAVSCGSPRAALALCDELGIGDGMPPLAVEAGREPFLLRGSGAGSPAVQRCGGGGAGSGRRGAAGVQSPGALGSPARAAAGEGGALVVGMRRCSLVAAGRRATSPCAHREGSAGGMPSALPGLASACRQDRAGPSVPDAGGFASPEDWWPDPGPESPWRTGSELLSHAGEDRAHATADMAGTSTWRGAARSPRTRPQPPQCHSHASPGSLAGACSHSSPQSPAHVASTLTMLRLRQCLQGPPVMPTEARCSITLTSPTDRCIMTVTQAYRNSVLPRVVVRGNHGRLAALVARGAAVRVRQCMGPWG
eukprot:jgi/Ulvmu1/6713/UM030_0046.1